MQIADWLMLQQWDAATRLLMLLHPWYALEQIGNVFGGGGSDLRPGWNRTVRDDQSQNKVVYTYVGDDEGQTTTEPPATGTPVHEATPAANDLGSSALWATVRALGQKLVARGVRPAVEVQGIEAAIETASRQKREMDRMDALARASLGGMRRSLIESRGGQIKFGDFEKPIFDLVESYLALDLAGMTASEVFSVVLSSASTTPPLGPPQMMPADARLAAIEHFADATYELLSQRAEMDVPGYYAATYLAGLYSRTAFLLANWARASNRHSGKQLERIAKLTLNIDELFAHRIGTAYLLPAVLHPRDLLGFIEQRAAQKQKPASEIATFYQLHPALHALLEPRPVWRNMTAEEIGKACFKESDRGRSFNATAALREEAPPIAPKNREAMMRAVMAISLGSMPKG